MTKRRIRSAKGLSAVMGAIGMGLSVHANAQTGADASIALGTIDNVNSWQTLADGSLEVTMANGQTVTVAPGQFTAVNGQIFVTEAAMASMEAASAAAAASSAGLGAAQIGLGAVGLGVAGFAVADAVDADGDSIPDGDEGGDEPGSENNAPVFTSSASSSVTDGSTSAYRAVASDADGDTLTYSLSGTDADLFTIDSSTGVVTFKTAPDYGDPGDSDGDNVYEVTVTVDDGSSTVSQDVTITVTNENTAPEFTSSATATIEENTSAVMTVAADDADGDTITYSISGGADAALFQIDSSTGELSFISAPDYENPGDAGANHVYDVIVAASDGTTTTTQAVAIAVSNVTETPEITSADAFTVLENHVNIGTITSTAGDGETLTYSIEAGGDASLFSINAATGELTFNAAPDYENPQDTGGDNVYDLTISVSDGITSSSQSVTVTVEDETGNESPYFTNASSIAIQENQTTAVTLAAADPEGGTLNYAITGGADAALFEFDGAGALVFTAAPDYEAPGDADEDNVYEVEVSVSDGTNTTYQTLQITVTDSADLEASDLPPEDGFVVPSGTPGSQLGYSVSAAGDVNGDGWGDFILASPFDSTGGDRAGMVYVVYGGNGLTDSLSGTTRANFDLSSFSSADGYIVQGEGDLDFLGWSVSSAGDINGDGLDDIILGAYNEDTGGPASGAAYVIFGQEGTSHADIDVTTLSASDGFMIHGAGSDQRLGYSVSSAGDVNGDGYDDILLGAEQGDGSAYVLYGGSGSFGTSDGAGRQVIDLATLSAGQGFLMNGGPTDGSLGASVSTLGDINGDGFADFIVGARYANSYAGEAYVIFGSDQTYGTAVSGIQTVDLATLDASEGFVLQNASLMMLGWSVSDAGDINGDGFDDILVGGYATNYATGDAFVIFGTDGSFGTASGGRQIIDVASIDAAEGFTIRGEAEQDRLGWSVSSAGDMNGDGYADIVLGATQAEKGDAPGLVYVIYGGADGFGTDDGSGGRLLDVSTLGTEDGFKVIGEEADALFGYSVSAAGDVDGDGFDDLLIGAPHTTGDGAEAGQSYIIYGSGDGQTGTTITGTAGSDVLVGTSGNDVLEGGGSDDIYRGGAGDDRMIVTGGAFGDVDGGSGFDVLVIDGTGYDFRYDGPLAPHATPYNVSSIEGIATINSASPGSPVQLVVGANFISAVSDLRIDGEASLIVSLRSGDSVLNLAEYTASGQIEYNGSTYDLYESGSVNLLIEEYDGTFPTGLTAETENLSAAESVDLDSATSDTAVLSAFAAAMEPSTSFVQADHVEAPLAVADMTASMLAEYAMDQASNADGSFS
ncbi:cadherin domain-containing protein [Altericroceibacterium spongiae]|nr:cadherin domain-containing protein [Altericroceibacterium spongiae]